MASKSDRPRVLLIAEACNPEWTSVPLLAYNWYRVLREHVDLTLVTQVRNRPGFCRTGRPVDVDFIDSEPLARPLHRLGEILTHGHPTALGTRGAISLAAYYYFEHLVWKRYRRPLLEGRFDLVHRLTPLSPTVPSPLARHCPVPFVLGPLNGALPWPPGTEHIRDSEGEWLAPIRSAHRMLPFWRQTFERAALVLAGARHVLREIPPRARRQTVIMAENGVDTNRFQPDPARPVARRRPFTILFVGRLVALKQPGVILEAVARMHARNDLRVVYVGDGPERQVLTAAVRRLGLTDHVSMLGHVPHERLPALFRQASVLALPSIHESGGAVLLEAMASGLPCVVLDYGGPAEYVRDGTGIRVPLGKAEAITAGFADAFMRLRNDPGALRRMTRCATQLAFSDYSWDAKAVRLSDLYRQVTARNCSPLSA